MTYGSAHGDSHVPFYQEELSLLDAVSEYQPFSLSMLRGPSTYELNHISQVFRWLGNITSANSPTCVLSLRMPTDTTKLAKCITQGINKLSIDMFIGNVDPAYPSNLPVELTTRVCGLRGTNHISPSPGTVASHTTKMQYNRNRTRNCGVYGRLM